MPVCALILHAASGAADGPLTRMLQEARRLLGERNRAGFLDAGADEARVAEEPADHTPFGTRLRRLAQAGELGPGGVVLLGSGALPLATAGDRARFVAAAAGAGGRTALANNRYSADVVAISQADVLRDVPDLPSDNALPRWLEEQAGFAVSDLRSRWRLTVDLDSPLDIFLLARYGLRWLHSPQPLEALAARLDRIRMVMDDPRAELLVSGRTSAGALGWLERHARCRVRAFVEERGLRAGSPLALGQTGGLARSPRSILGARLDRDGPESLGRVLAELADGALVDTRVLLAHRLGLDELRWPAPEDRFASDLLLPEAIVDPWLRALTTSALQAAVPVLLGGHSLVGPGVRLVRGSARIGSG